MVKVKSKKVNMKTYEYMTISLNAATSAINNDELNKYGNDGWLLVYWSDYTMVFAREKIEF